MPDSQWKTVGRPPYSVRSLNRLRRVLDRQYGPDSWRLVHLINGSCYSLAKAAAWVEAAYLHFAQRNVELVEQLCREARDVMEMSRTNVHAGFDFGRQERRHEHVFDIALRRSLHALGRQLEGDRLVRIAGKGCTSPWNPGTVPFHQQDLILQPELRGWWQPGSIQSFWLSNRVLQVKS